MLVAIFIPDHKGSYRASRCKSRCTRHISVDWTYSLQERRGPFL